MYCDTEMEYTTVVSSRKEPLKIVVCIIIADFCYSKPFQDT